MKAQAPSRTVAPGAQLISLEDAKAHLKVEATDEDEYIEILDQAETSVPHIDPSTQRVLSHRKRLRFPYRRVAAPHVDA